MSFLSLMYSELPGARTRNQGGFGSRTIFSAGWRRPLNRLTGIWVFINGVDVNLTYWFRLPAITVCFDPLERQALTFKEFLGLTSLLLLDHPLDGRVFCARIDLLHCSEE